MSKTKFSYIVSVMGVGLSLLATTPAKADVYLYTDTDHKYTFSVPDTWSMKTPATPNTDVRFVSGVPGDHAYCEVEVKRDGRFKIYPKHLMGDVVDENLDAAFWEDEAHRRFSNPEIRAVRTTAGLDKGDASMAQILYDAPTGEGAVDSSGKYVEDTMRMRSVLLASLYGDKRFVMTCGARAEKFHKWSKLFGSVMSSMTLADSYHLIPTGFYRNFLKDKYTALPHTGLGMPVE